MGIELSSEDEQAIRILEVTIDAADHNRLLELPRGSSPALLTGGCRGSLSNRAASERVARRPNGSSSEPRRQAHAEHARCREAHLRRTRLRAPDGRAPLVTDGYGHFLLSSSSEELGDPSYGPVEWTDLPCPPYSDRRAAALSRRSTAFELLRPLRWPRLRHAGWGLSEHDVFYAGDDLHHVDVDDYIDGSGAGFVALHGSPLTMSWALQPGRMVHYDGSTWISSAVPFRLVEGVFAVHPRRAWAFGHAGALLRFDGARLASSRKPSSADLVTPSSARALTGSGSPRIETKSSRATARSGPAKSLPKRRPRSTSGATAAPSWRSSRWHALETPRELARGSRAGRAARRLLRPAADLDGRSASDVWISTRQGRLIHYDGKNFSTFDSRTRRDLRGSWR